MASEETIRLQVRTFLREALAERYAAENMARYEELAELPGETAVLYRAFVLTRVYPDSPAREQIDAAFQRLEAMLRSPLKVKALMGAMLPLLWRLGRQMPSILLAGQRVMTAFDQMRQLEEAAVGAYMELENGRGAFSGKKLRAAFKELPAERFEQMVDSLTALLEAVGDRNTIAATLELLQKIADAMRGKPGAWGGGEYQDVLLALETLSEGERLFALIEPKQMPRLIAGVRRVEEDWINGLRA